MAAAREEQECRGMTINSGTQTEQIMVNREYINTSAMCLVVDEPAIKEEVFTGTKFSPK